MVLSMRVFEGRMANWPGVSWYKDMVRVPKGQSLFPRHQQGLERYCL